MESFVLANFRWLTDNQSLAYQNPLKSTKIVDYPTDMIDGYWI